MKQKIIFGIVFMFTLLAMASPVSATYIPLPGGCVNYRCLCTTESGSVWVLATSDDSPDKRTSWEIFEYTNNHWVKRTGTARRCKSLTVGCNNQVFIGCNDSDDNAWVERWENGKWVPYGPKYHRDWDPFIRNMVQSADGTLIAWVGHYHHGDCAETCKVTKTSFDCIYTRGTLSNDIKETNIKVSPRDYAYVAGGDRCLSVRYRQGSGSFDTKIDIPDYDQYYIVNLSLGKDGELYIDARYDCNYGSIQRILKISNGRMNIIYDCFPDDTVKLTMLSACPSGGVYVFNNTNSKYYIMRSNGGCVPCDNTNIILAKGIIDSKCRVWGDGKITQLSWGFSPKVTQTSISFSPPYWAATDFFDISRDGGKTWKKGLTLTGLKSGTEYSVKIRANLDGWNGSPASIYSVRVITVPPTPGLPQAVSSPLSWHKTEGRGRIKLSWAATRNATGYKVHVFDGKDYRKFDVGNSLSWDSSTWKIYPKESTINGYSTNTRTNDIFNHVKGGLNLRDNPSNLYRSAANGTYNSYHNYWFKVSAYNAFGESSPGAVAMPTLPTTTDPQVPTVTTVQINDGQVNAGSPSVKVKITAKDNLSGLAKVQISSDNFSTYEEYRWPTVGEKNGTAEFPYTLISGEGSKTVQTRTFDQAGNVSSAKSASIYLINDSQPPAVNFTINGGSKYTDKADVKIVIMAQDNLTPPAQMRMKLSLDGGNNFIYEGPFSVERTLNLGSTGGEKFITVIVADANGNQGVAVQSIYYTKDVATPQDSTPSPSMNQSTFGENLDGKIIDFHGCNTEVVQRGSTTLNLTKISTKAGRLQLEITINGVNWSDPDVIPTGATSYNKNITFDTEGFKMMDYRLMNTYGAISKSYTRYYLVDHTSPLVDVKIANNASAVNTGTVKLAIKAHDNICNTTELGYSINNSRYQALPSDGMVTYSGLSKGYNTLNIKVVDQAGNIAIATANIWRL